MTNLQILEEDNMFLNLIGGGGHMNLHSGGSHTSDYIGDGHIDRWRSGL